MQCCIYAPFFDEMGTKWAKPWVTVISLGMAIELQGGGLAYGRILQVVKVSIVRVCYQQG